MLLAGSDFRFAIASSSTDRTSFSFRSLLAAEIGVAISELKGAERLGALGVNSIAAVRLRHLMERSIGGRVPLDILHPVHTVDEVEASLHALRRAAAGAVPIVESHLAQARRLQR